MDIDVFNLHFTNEWCCQESLCKKCKIIADRSVGNKFKTKKSCNIVLITVTVFKENTTFFSKVKL